MNPGALRSHSARRSALARRTLNMPSGLSLTRRLLQTSLRAQRTAEARAHVVERCRPLHAPSLSPYHPLMFETPEALFARAAHALRMPPVEEWEEFPFDGDMRPRALLPPVEREAPRQGEGGG